jgi:hypothetical protein
VRRAGSMPVNGPGWRFFPPGGYYPMDSESLTGALSPVKQLSFG